MGGVLIAILSEVLQCTTVFSCLSFCEYQAFFCSWLIIWFLVMKLGKSQTIILIFHFQFIIVCWGDDFSNGIICSRGKADSSNRVLLSSTGRLYLSGDKALIL